jgi:hypothetical protein
VIRNPAPTPDQVEDMLFGIMRWREVYGRAYARSIGAGPIVELA